MGEVRFVLIDLAGLHARPAARFVQTASRFRSTVTIAHGSREASAKSLLSLLGLALRQGSEIVLRADGDDADAALTALTTELAPFVERIPAAKGQIAKGVS
jgi:phosphotransferase system HPr (HPr) family protein